MFPNFSFACRSSFLLLAFFPNLFALICIASPVVDSPFDKRGTTAQVPATIIFTFPNGIEGERIAPRRDGQLLVTVNTSPDLYQIDPFRTQVGGVVHTFHGYQSLFGIVELQEQDVFYVVANNFTGAPDFYGFPGSNSLFRVDLRGVRDPTVAQNTVKVSKVVDIPQTQLLDGFDVLNKTAGLLVSADAQTGTIYIIDVYQRTATAVLQNLLLEGNATARAAGIFHLGANGVRVYGSNLYFTNTAKGTFGMVPIDRATGIPTGTPSILASYETLTDDFSFDVNGNAFISEPLLGVLLRPAGTTPTNNHTRLISPWAGANSNAIGRTPRDICTLYATNEVTSELARIDVGKLGLCNVKNYNYTRGFI